MSVLWCLPVAVLVLGEGSGRDAEGAGWSVKPCCVQPRGLEPCGVIERCCARGLRP